MLLLLMFAILLAVLIVGLHIYKNDIISPAIIFTTSFIFSVIWAIFYSNTWKLSLHFNTFSVIVGGVVVFLIISMITYVVAQSFFGKVENTKVNFSDSVTKKSVLGRGVIISIVIYEFLVAFIVSKSIIDVVGGSWSTLSETTFQYRNAMSTAHPYVLPQIINTLMLIVVALGYWLGYLFVKEFVVDRYFDKGIFIAIIVAIFAESSVGSRGPSINTIFAMIMFYILFYVKVNGKINFKIVKKVVTYLLLIIIAFLVLGSLIGRQAANGMTMVDYLAEYFGAEIKNLDIYLQTKGIANSVFGGQTFYSIVKNKIPGYSLVLPFQSINHFSLGNVYTTFYPYIFDFGYVGVPVLTGCMAFLSQIVYEISKREKLTVTPGIATLVYGYMFPALVQSFFSNKFYEELFNSKFIKICILWIVYNFALSVYVYISNRVKIKF